MACPKTLQNFLFLLVIILFKSIPNLSLIYFDSKQLGSRLCTKIPDNLSTCPIVNSTVFDHLLQPDSFPNITSPRIAIKIDPRANFNVRFQSSKMIHNVSQFVMTGENTQVEIELLNTYDYLATCFSFGSTSTLSSNAMNSPKFEIDYSNKGYPYLYTLANVRISRKIANSGYLTCRSIENKNHSETFTIFTHPSAQTGTSPFASVHELTIQSDEAGGFIVPCRTNYRMENPPDLLWKNHETDDFTKFTPEEMKSFKWDPSKGFQFNISGSGWEMQSLTCRVGSFNKTFFPTPSGFNRTSIFVKASGSQIGCGLRSRNDSSDPLVDAKSLFKKARYYSCSNYINCQVALESGMQLEPNYYERTFRMELQDLNKNFGIFSCYLGHPYDGELTVPEVSSKVFFKGLDSNVYLLPGPYPNSSVIQISEAYGPFYNNDQNELYRVFDCITLDFFVARRVYFKLQYRNLTETVQSGLNKELQKGVSHKAQFNVSLDTNVTHALCFYLTQEGKFISSELRQQTGAVDVLPPVITNAATNTSGTSVLDNKISGTAASTSKANHVFANGNHHSFITLVIIGYCSVTVTGLTF